MYRRKFPVLVLLLMLAGLFTAPTATATAPSPGPAPAAKATGHSYLSFTGGSMVRALGTTISSDMTAQSTISGTKLPNRMASRTASVKVRKLVNVGAIHTSTEAERLGKKRIRITSKARTANVSLLNGLITAKAVETKNVTRGAPRDLNARTNTKFVDIKIAGIKLPVDIPKNFRVVIPGVAAVVLNASQTSQKNGIVINQGYALGIWLLKSRGKLPIGTQVMLNPTYTIMGMPVPPSRPALGGYAYGTNAQLNVTDAVEGEIGRTGQATTPPNGTNGRKEYNRTADVEIPGILHVGAISSFTRSRSAKKRGYVNNVNKIAGVDVLDGLITADALRVRAKVRLRNGKFRRKEGMTFVNLKIAGQEIPVDVSKNTKINIAGVAKVWINQRKRTATGTRIRGIYVKLLEPRAGLKAGARIEVAVASAYMWR